MDNAMEQAVKMPEEMGLRFIMMVKIDLYLSEGKKEKAKALMEKLRDSVDKIRKNYWQWQINKLQ